VSAVRKRRIRVPRTPHLAQLPANRPTAGIRQQYQHWNSEPGQGRQRGQLPETAPDPFVSAGPAPLFPAGLPPPPPPHPPGSTPADADRSHTAPPRPPAAGSRPAGPRRSGLPAWRRSLLSKGSGAALKGVRSLCLRLLTPFLS